MFNEQSYHTPEGVEKIKAEIEALYEEREKIGALLEAATEKGDLSENSEYHTLKETQGLIAMQIRELESSLRNGKVIEKSHNGVIGVGNRVRLKSSQGVLEFNLVGPEEIDLANGKISYASPLGQALMGKKKGAIVEVQTPKGNVKYKIIEVE